MRTDTVVQQMAFHAWRSSPQVMPVPHSHTDLELNLPLTGTLRYFFAGQFHTLEVGRLVVFWGGMPHRLVAKDTDAEYLCMTLPLGVFLSWSIDRQFTGRLLSGEMVSGDDALDLPLFARWATDLSTRPADTSETKRIVLLEVEARLRRLARERGGEQIGRTGAVPTGGQVERIAALLAERYQDADLSVDAIASEVNLHPNYALTVFREGCGMTIWDYLTRLRVSHAQRLLMTTDWTGERIALECGFGSMSRFYAVFKEHCGVTPGRYRK